MGPSSCETDDLPTRTQPGHSIDNAQADGVGLFWVSPEERFHELEVGGAIGRANDCALRLEGPSVSRHHALLQKNGSVWMLRDLGSKNGTFVNGSRQELAPLSIQDTVRAGDWVGVVCAMPAAAIEQRKFFGEVAPGIIFSATTLATLGDVAALAKRNTSVLIEGETGTGKELLARAIHELSGRGGPLVAVNCAAIPEGIAEAELFGYKKGAFSGAVDAAPGLIAAADGGTLFLDEIVELRPAIQSKLLRVLEDHAVRPLGTTRSVRVDFRLVAAAQSSLEKLVYTGAFRADLYARLHGVALQLPPLRERRQETLRLLCNAIEQALGQRPTFDSRAVERLCMYAWPYNVREINQLAHLFTVSGKHHFSVEDLPQRMTEPRSALRSGIDAAESNDASESTRRQAWLARHAVELHRLKRALQQCNGNVSEAARALSMPRHRARRLLEAEEAISK